MYATEIEIVSRLDELGLSHENLKQAVDAGEVARVSCSAYHPRNAPGFFAWAECVAALREVLAPAGFVADDPDGLPLIVNHERGIAIAVAAGDAGTGRPDREVRTKYHKGYTAKNAVYSNEQQLELGFQTRSTRREVTRASMTGSLLTYYLLRRRWNNRIFWELSLPTAIESTSDEEPRYRLVGWAERIFLPAYDVLPDLVIEGDLDDASEEVDFEIQRR